MRGSGTIPVLVAGASGLIGSRLVAMCGADPRYGPVHVLTRRPLSPGAAGGVEEHVVDFDRLAAADLGGAEIEEVHCALGTTMRRAGSKAAFRRVDHDYVVAVGELAARLGARRFLLVSALGADPASASFYLRVKGETEADLAAIGLPRLLIFRPSLLAGSRGETRRGESLANAALGLVGPLVPRRLRPVPDEVLARAMIAAAREETAGVRIYESDEIQSLGRA
jgi:uncharacterized protein YbjT (DUF2867 family)